MMKNTFAIFIFVALASTMFGQVDATIDKGSGWLYFTGIPGTTPNITAGSEVAINTQTREAYVWNRDSSEWQKWLLVDSLTYSGDTLRLYQNGSATALSVAIIPPGVDSLTYSSDTLRLYFSGIEYAVEVQSGSLDSVSYYGGTLRIYQGGNPIPYEAEIKGGIYGGSGTVPSGTYVEQLGPLRFDIDSFGSFYAGDFDELTTGAHISVSNYAGNDGAVAIRSGSGAGLTDATVRINNAELPGNTPTAEGLPSGDYLWIVSQAGVRKGQDSTGWIHIDTVVQKNPYLNAPVVKSTGGYRHFLIHRDSVLSGNYLQDVVDGKVMLISEDISTSDTVTIPADLGFVPPFTIWRKTEKKFKTSVDDLSVWRDSFMVRGVEKYVTTSGSNSNSGNTESLAYRTLSKAIIESNTKEIYVKSGIYAGGQSLFDTIRPYGSKSIIGYGGEVIIGAIATKRNWTAHPVYSGVFRMDTTLFGSGGFRLAHVVDLRFRDEFNAPMALDSVTSLAVLAVTENAYMTQNDSLYVHLRGGVTPNQSTNVVPVLNFVVYVTRNHLADTIYFENVTFMGSVYAKSNDAALFFRNCNFFYGAKKVTTSSGFTIPNSIGDNDQIIIDSIDIVGFHSCTFAYAWMDQLNYKGATKMFEVNCSANYAGMDPYNPAMFHQNSSLHYGCLGVRVNSSYAMARNENVFDTDDTGQLVRSFNLGCEFLGGYNSQSTSNTTANFRMDAGTAWLEKCTLGGDKDYNIIIDDNGTINFLDTRTERVNKINGTLKYY